MPWKANMFIIELKCIDRVKVFVEEALSLKNGQIPLHGVIYLENILHYRQTSSTELPFVILSL